MTVSDKYSRFPCLQSFAAETQVSEENLVAAFRLETEFHRRLLLTDDARDRKLLYSELYAAVHALLRPTGTPTAQRRIEKQREQQARALALCFRKELVGHSILDVGCGDGHFLKTLKTLIPHGDLWGLDVSRTQLPSDCEDHIRFVQQDVVSFSLSRKFDIVFSNQVQEHLSPSDLPEHLTSIHRVLSLNGQFIVRVPNRFWGPSDITRIVDNTYTGNIPAQGSHVNETSYGELIPLLREHGFHKIRTVVPIAHKLPLVRSVRLTPWPNVLLEASPIRHLLHALKWRGKAAFTNLVVLICRK
jgi:SAM-dependent methyltransferase